MAWTISSTEQALDGENPSLVRRWAGHRSYEMTDYYFGLAEAKLAAIKPKRSSLGGLAVLPTKRGRPRGSTTAAGSRWIGLNNYCSSPVAAMSPFVWRPARSSMSWRPQPERVGRARPARELTTRTAQSRCLADPDASRCGIRARRPNPRGTACDIAPLSHAPARATRVRTCGYTNYGRDGSADRTRGSGQTPSLPSR